MTAADVIDRPEPATGTVALVLDAGGARSAYQVGALDVLLPELERRGERPTVVVGTSAGALISGGLAATAHLDAAGQAAALVELLDRATKPDVIRPLWRQVPEVLVRYASETLGLTRFRLRGLFGTEPLARTLTEALDWERLHRNLDDGLLDLVAVTATAVRTGRVTLFAEGRGGPAGTSGSSAGLPEPDPTHHRAYVSCRLDVPHLMASAAIPALFPSVRVDEPADVSGWYVDGATRRRHPLVPALELGADRVVAVGTGSLRQPAPDVALDQEAVDLGDAVATLLGSVMDDPMRHDLRRLRETNALLEDAAVADAVNARRERLDQRPLRPVPHVAVAPQHGDDLARVAMEVYRENHGTLLGTAADPDLQVVHRLLGSDSPLQGELLSYLLFDRDFFDAAAELGRRDAREWLDGHPDLWAL